MKQLEKLKAKYLKAKEAYYNAQPIMTDEEFDSLENQIRKVLPEWEGLSATGVPVKNKKTEVKLLRPMPSLHKAYPEAIGKWFAKNPKGPYLIMDKLDGSSLQVVYKHGRLSRVITRGNGVLGGDITFLAPHLNLPQEIERTDDDARTIFRCEAIIRKASFLKKWADEFDNARNMVNGLLNRKTPHPALADVDIVVLGCFTVPLLEGLKYAASEGFKTVPYSTVSTADHEQLTNMLEKRLVDSKYDMDGLVIAQRGFVFDYKDADKPKEVIAYKVNTDEAAVEVVVDHIIWQVSGRGRIIPKIKIKPTLIGGVTVVHATSHNAKWMLDRKIGPGAVIKVVRSGGVIPKIVGVVRPAKKAQLPEVEFKVSGVHFVVNKANTDTAKKIELERLAKFMTTMGIEFLAKKTLAKLQLWLLTPQAYVKAWFNKRLSSTLINAGVGATMATKIVKEFDRVFGKKVSMLQLMVASQCFGVGIGERKLRQLEDAGISMGWISVNPSSVVHAKVSNVHGWSRKTADLLVDGRYDWVNFLSEVGSQVLIEGGLPKKEKVIKGKLSGERVSFTGYRDKDHEAAVIAAGGEVVSFGSKTTILLIKIGGKESTKVDKARSAGIKVAHFASLKL